MNVWETMIYDTFRSSISSDQKNIIIKWSPAFSIICGNMLFIFLIEQTIDYKKYC